MWKVKVKENQFEVNSQDQNLLEASQLIKTSEGSIDPIKVEGQKDEQSKNEEIKSGKLEINWKNQNNFHVAQNMQKQQNNFIHQNIHQNFPQNMAQELPNSSWQHKQTPQFSSQSSQTDFSTIHKDIEGFLKMEKFKDFKIIIESENSKVEVMIHKFLFMARSETFRELIEENPDADELVLKDIRLDIFQSILDFIYEDKISFDESKAREVFVAAEKLKIEELKLKSAEILIEKINND
jgi:hypothetical protein